MKTPRLLPALAVAAALLLGVATPVVADNVGTITGVVAGLFGGQPPRAQGTSGQTLVADGAGNITWGTASGPPTGAAGGDLGGTYPNPTVLSLANVTGGMSAALNTLGSTQGQVLYRSAAGWTVLAVGTSGQFLTTGGAGADPSWTTIATTLQAAYNGGNTIAVAANTPVAISKSTATNSTFTVTNTGASSTSTTVLTNSGNNIAHALAIFQAPTGGGVGGAGIQVNMSDAATAPAIDELMGSSVGNTGDIFRARTAALSPLFEVTNGARVNALSHYAGSTGTVFGSTASGSDPSGALVWGLSYVGSGIAALGNGTAANATGTLRLTTLQAPAATTLSLGANATSYWSIGTTGLLTAGTGIASGGVQIKGPSDAGFQIESGTNQIFYFGTHEAQDVNIFTTNVSRWKVNPTGGFVGITNGAAHITWTNDNASDIGASGATRPRTGYFGTSVVTATVNAPSATTLNLGGGGASQWAIGSDGHLIPATGNTYDIGNNAGPGVNTVRDFYLGGLTKRYKNIDTAGWGVETVYGAGSATAQTGAVALVAAYTPAADGDFIVSMNALVTTATTHAFDLRCAYTDEGNTARVLVFTLSNVGGTLLTSIVNTGGTVPYEGVPLHIRAKGGTSITLRTETVGEGGVYTSVVYNVRAVIRQLQ